MIFSENRYTLFRIMLQARILEGQARPNDAWRWTGHPLPTKSFPRFDEAILKQISAYPSPFMGSLTQQIFGCLAAGEAFVTFFVAFLVCCSAAVFLAHAFDAYHA
jgi:hypothetical protein